MPSFTSGNQDQDEVVGHEKRRCPIDTVAWDNVKEIWKTAKTNNTKLLCAVCKTRYRTTCAYNPAILLCEQYHHNHEEDQKPQNSLQEKLGVYFCHFDRICISWILEDFMQNDFSLIVVIIFLVLQPIKLIF